MLSAVLLAVAFAFANGPALAQMKELTGKQFDSAFPKDFYLEGNAIPTEKRNAALISTSNSARVLFGLIDTTGYSSQVQQKYIGMIITEGELEVCGHNLGVGSYGFGLEKPADQSRGDAQLHLYDQAGKQIFACGASKDAKLTKPKPLEVATTSSRLYLGRYWVAIK